MRAPSRGFMILPRISCLRNYFWLLCLATFAAVLLFQRYSLHVSTRGTNIGLNGTTHLMKCSHPKQVASLSPTPFVVARAAGSPYVVALDYQEQLASATRNVVQLSRIAVGWNMSLAAPFIKGSSLQGVPKVSTDLPQLIRFEEVYDLSGVDRILQGCWEETTRERRSVLVSFCYFLATSYRDVVAVNFIKNGKEIVDYFQGTNHSSIINCTHIAKLKGVLSKVESRLNLFNEDQEFVNKVRFKVIGMICVNALYSFSLNELQRTLFGEASIKRADFTIAVLEWRGAFNDKLFYYSIPDFHYSDSTCPFATLPHSNHILKEANSFQRSLRIGRPYVAIHIRFERLFQVDDRNPGHLIHCFKRLHNVVMNITKKYNLSTGSVVAMYDYSNYGSETCLSRKDCSLLAMEFTSQLQRWGITMVQYNPEVFNGTVDRGFVSLVEKQFLSQADFLVTLGWGGFQRSVTQMFREGHSENNWFSICSRYYGDHLPGLQIT